jgi:acetyl-CoA acetyltransferase
VGSLLIRTAVDGCSFIIHVRHAAAAIASGLCKTVLITHGESGRSGVGRTRPQVAPSSLAGQFEQPYGPMGPPTLFTAPVLRYMKTYGLSHEQLAMVSVVQREWAAKNPCITFKAPITVDDVLNSRNSRKIAYPFGLLQCCSVANGGGLSCMHSGMYGIYALQESVRQMRGTAPAQCPTPRSRSATASVACSLRRAPSSCRTRRLRRSNGLRST